MCYNLNEEESLQKMKKIKKSNKNITISSNGRDVHSLPTNNINNSRLSIWNILLICLLLIILFIVFYYIKNSNEKKEEKIKEDF